MKIFLDTANLDELRAAAALGIVDGVTTNPSLIAKEGRSNVEQIRAICEIVDGDISAEVVSTEAEEMIREGHELAAIHPNVVVKCPLIPEGIQATKALSSQGIRVNVTLCFSAAQALLAAKAGAYIVSPFMGRLDDIRRKAPNSSARSSRSTRTTISRRRSWQRRFEDRCTSKTLPWPGPTSRRCRPRSSTNSSSTR